MKTKIKLESKFSPERRNRDVIEPNVTFFITITDESRLLRTGFPNIGIPLSFFFLPRNEISCSSMRSDELYIASVAAHNSVIRPIAIRASLFFFFFVKDPWDFKYDCWVRSYDFQQSRLALISFSAWQ